MFNKLLKGEYKVKSVDKKSEVCSNFWIVANLDYNEKAFVRSNHPKSGNVLQERLGYIWYEETHLLHSC